MSREKQKAGRKRNTTAGPEREHRRRGGLEAHSASPPPFRAPHSGCSCQQDGEKGLPANREALLKALAVMFQQHQSPEWRGFPPAGVSYLADS
uniref:Uncharacterized protein n=1 Tax=Citrobacter freundii TaxID=546 RepID=A0A3S5I489_CITFR|nr:hypothetical protein [Citrobacter freundii]